MRTAPETAAPEQGASVQAIGRARTIWPEKFGVPRQPGLVAADGWIEFFPPFDREEAFVGLEKFSHVWVVFRFDRHSTSGRLSVRPPRLGGNRRLGVFATRSSWRPNGLGLSVVALRAIEKRAGRVRLRVAGLDTVDGTEIVDIKPYLPWADAIEDAHGGFAARRPQPMLRVVWAPDVLNAEGVLAGTEPAVPTAAIREQIEATIALDPRPAYRARAGVAPDGLRPSPRYHVRVAGWEVGFTVEGEVAMLDSLQPDARVRIAVSRVDAHDPAKSEREGARE